MATLKAHGGKVASVTIQVNETARMTYVLCADGAILKAVQVQPGYDGPDSWTPKSYKIVKTKAVSSRNTLVQWRDRTLGQYRNAVLISEEGLAPFEVVADLRVKVASR